MSKDIRQFDICLNALKVTGDRLRVLGSHTVAGIGGAYSHERNEMILLNKDVSRYEPHAANTYFVPSPHNTRK